MTDGNTTTKNFSLSAAPVSACLVDTTQADFQTGTPTNVDLTASPGDVVLLIPVNIDQQNTSVTFNGFGFTSTSWAGQTFTAGVSGQLTQVDLNLFCSGCTGTTPNITVSIRATTGSPALPTGADLASATIAGFSSDSGGYFSATFASPPTLTAGVVYAIVFRAVSNPSAGTYAYVCSCGGFGAVNSNPYANGRRVTSTNSGSTWTADPTSGGRDLGFKVYMKSGFAPSGDQISSLKDSNPAAGITARWTTLAWTASTPANTTLKFQAAASNSAFGPFNFVGPDTTAATFFTVSGASLAQFNGKRYLRYRAYPATTNSAVTPTLNDVTTCFQSVPDLTIDDVSHNEGNSGTTTFTFTVSLSTPAGMGGVTFDIATADGTATAPSDYTARSLTGQTIPAGSTTYTFDVLVNGDTTSEPDETFLVNVTNIVNAAGVDTQGQGTIVNDDAASADLSVTNIDTPDPAFAGNNLAYAITVNNAGPSSAASVSLSDSLPAGTTFVSLASPGGWVCSTPAVGVGGTVSCSDANVAVGNALFTLVVKVGAAVIPGTVLTNTATVSSATADPDSGNNSATATTTVGIPRIDVDGDGHYDALTDGVLMIRYLFGLTGDSLTSGVIGTGASRSTPAAVQQYLDSMRAQLDVDGNGEANQLTDGLLLIRYLFGLRGPSLITGAIGPGAIRATAGQIESYIQALMP